MLNALGEATSKLRSELGESLATVQKFDVPLAQATTSSLEALQAFSLGQKVAREKGAEAALAYHQRAIDLIPNFAHGLSATVGNDYDDLGELGRARRVSTPRHSSCGITPANGRGCTLAGDYYGIVTGELDKAAQTYQDDDCGLSARLPRILDLSTVYG